MTNLVDKIKQICKQQGISIDRLEKECGLSHTSIAKWQKSSPKLENVLKVCNALNIGISDIAPTQIEIDIAKEYEKIISELKRENEQMFTDKKVFENLTEKYIKNSDEYQSLYNNSIKKVDVSETKLLKELAEKNNEIERLENLINSYKEEESHYLFQINTLKNTSKTEIQELYDKLDRAEQKQLIGNGIAMLDKKEQKKKRN